jgi:protein-S-isoprenylcysteine O-methyltransferase Ste14
MTGLTKKGLCFAFLAFLLALDVFVPPVPLPEVPVSRDDRLAGLFGIAWIWAAPKTIQVLLALAVGLVSLVQHTVLTHAVFGHREGTKFATCGALVALLGWGLRLWAKSSLASFFTYRLSQPSTLVTAGPYMYWLHPGYAGNTFHVGGLLMVGVATWDQREIVAVCGTAMVLAVLQMRILDEEHLLKEIFGQRWAMHAAERWRLLPFVW